MTSTSRVTPVGVILAYTLVVMLLVACGNAPAEKAIQASSQPDGYEAVAATSDARGGSSRLGLRWNFFFNNPVHTQPNRPIPVKSIDRITLQVAPDGSLPNSAITLRGGDRGPRKRKPT